MLDILSSVWQTPSIHWLRTTLAPLEREALLRALKSEQKAHLAEHDYIDSEGSARELSDA